MTVDPLGGRGSSTAAATRARPWCLLGHRGIWKGRSGVSGRKSTEGTQSVHLAELRNWPCYLITARCYTRLSIDPAAIKGEMNLEIDLIDEDSRAQMGSE